MRRFRFPIVMTEEEEEEEEEREGGREGGREAYLQSKLLIYNRNCGRGPSASIRKQSTAALATSFLLEYELHLNRRIIVRSGGRRVAPSQGGQGKLRCHALGVRVACPDGNHRKAGKPADGVPAYHPTTPITTRFRLPGITKAWTHTSRTNLTSQQMSGTRRRYLLAEHSAQRKRNAQLSLGGGGLFTIGIAWTSGTTMIKYHARTKETAVFLAHARQKLGLPQGNLNPQ